MGSINIGKNFVLRKNAIEKENQTGYPHIDKSHLQYYSVESLVFGEVPDLSMYGLVNKYLFNHQNEIALEYFGTKVTYRDFMQKINEYSRAFYNLGVKQGEIVSIASPNIPEICYSIYALNKIGAVVNLIDPRNDVGRIKKFINDANSTKLIMLDIVYPKIEKIIEETSLEQVYTVSAVDSLPVGLNYIQRAKTLVENKRKKLPACPENDVYKSLVKEVFDYSHKMVDGKYLEIVEDRKNVKDELAVIVNTSGTTGTPKGVMLSNENLNAVAIDYKYSGMKYEAGDKFLGIMPNFLAYGIGVGMHMTFVLGLTNIIIPAVTLESFPKLIRKHHPAHFAGVPDHFQHLIDDKKMKNYDLSFIKTAAAGGASMDPTLKQRTNDFLISHGSPEKIKIGYGCSENTGLAATQIYVGESDELNELTTVGIPALHTGVRIVSPETKEDLKYNQDGEILLTGKGVMQGYINNEDETKKVIEYIDGIKHLHTGDIGHVDENGRLYIVDRIKRIIIRADGHNVFPVYIENVVNEHPSIKSCVCVGLKDNSSVNGKAPVAFIVLEKGNEANVEQIIDELKTICLQKLPERDVALDYIVLENLPMTPAGKVDYRYLEDNYEYNNLTRKRKN